MLKLLEAYLADPSAKNAAKVRAYYHKHPIRYYAVTHQEEAADYAQAARDFIGKKMPYAARVMQKYAAMHAKRAREAMMGGGGN